MTNLIASSQQQSPTDLTSPAARADRDQLATRVDVLDKVGVLRTLPDDMHVTTEMVAEFFDVGIEAVRQLVVRNRDELDEDGYRIVTRSVFESDIASLSNVDPRARQIALFPRRAVLRVGMLLRDSIVARSVRGYLLDAERPIAPSVPDITTPAGLLAMTEMFADTARRLVAATEARQQLEAKVEHQAPLVAKAEAHTASTSTIHRQEFAREVQAWGQKIHGIHIKHKHVYDFLGYKGMTVRGNRTDANQATSLAVANRWAWTDKGTTEDGKTYATTRLYPKGQDIAWKWITKHVEANGTLELPREIGPAA